MKLTIDKHITIGDAVQARKILNDFKSSDNIEILNMSEMKHAGAVYINEAWNDNVKIYESSARISYYSNGNGSLLTNEENALTKYPLDIYIELFVKGSDSCADIGFYLTDFWQLTGDNADEIRSKAYINLFKREQI